MDKKMRTGNTSLLLLLLAGMFVTLLNVSIINVMLPQIMTQFNCTATAAQWLSTGFMLLASIVITLVPWLSKRFQYKTLFITAMVSLVTGSLLCFISPIFPLLLIGRLIQALGYGLLLPLSMILVLAITPPQKRGFNMGLLSIGMLLAPALGPTLAGITITYLSWRFLFLIMALIGAAVLLVSLATFHYRNATQSARPDLWGILLSASGLTALLYGINQAGTSGWNHLGVLLPLMGGILLLALFVLVELKRPDPLLNLRVFKDYNFSSNVVVTVVLQMVLTGALMLMPLYFENVMGYSGLKTGLLLLPASLLTGITGVIAGRLYDKIGIKPLAIAGTLIMVVAAILLARLTPATPFMQSFLAYTFFVLGTAVISTPITTAAYARVPQAQNGHAATLQNALRQVAGAIGVSVLITTMSFSSQSLDLALSPVAGASPAVLAASHGIASAFTLALALCALALLLSLFLVSKRKMVGARMTVGR